MNKINKEKKEVKIINKLIDALFQGKYTEFKKQQNKLVKIKK